MMCCVPLKQKICFIKIQHIIILTLTLKALFGNIPSFFKLTAYCHGRMSGHGGTQIASTKSIQTTIFRHIRSCQFCCGNCSRCNSAWNLQVKKYDFNIFIISERVFHASYEHCQKTYRNVICIADGSWFTCGNCASCYA